MVGPTIRSLVCATSFTFEGGWSTRDLLLCHNPVLSRRLHYLPTGRDPIRSRYRPMRFTR
jgi:hypothetical protein